MRRVGIALSLYGLPFEHRPWSTLAMPTRSSPYNPLTRVPTLVLDDGEALIESHCRPRAVSTAWCPPSARCFPASNRIAGARSKWPRWPPAWPTRPSACFQKRLHAAASEVWVARCRAQIAGVLAALPGRSGQPGPGDFWFDERIGHADIAVAVALRFLGEAHPGVAPLDEFPALAGSMPGGSESPAGVPSALPSPSCSPPS